MNVFTAYVIVLVSFLASAVMLICNDHPVWGGLCVLCACSISVKSKRKST